jgi:outer membrane protein
MELAMKLFARLAALTAFTTAAFPAMAADIPARAPARAPAPTVVSPAFDPFMIRVRAIAVLPEGASSTNVAGVGVEASKTYVPEIDVSYFFTKNIAIEAICCVSPHKINAVGALNAKVGSTVLFPPTVLLQYHFTDFGAFKPYVGVGVNYTHFFRNKTAAGFADLDLDPSVGVAGQIGFDYMIDRNWGVNVDVKKIMIRPDAKVTLVGTGDVTSKVKIDPWVIGVGLTYRFGGSSAVLARY